MGDDPYREVGMHQSHFRRSSDPTPEAREAARIADMYFDRDGEEWTRGKALAEDIAALLSSWRPQWREIESAPKDGTEVWVYVAPTPRAPDLKPFQCVCAWHPDAGWCADELREVTHWQPLPEPPP